MNILKLSIKQKTILGIILSSIIFIVIIILAIINIPKTATLQIEIAPSDATITINDKIYHNGSYKIEPGTYHIVIQRQDFESIEQTINVNDKENYHLLECLSGSNNYYQNHPDDDMICRKKSENVASEIANNLLKRDKIFSITPYHSYSDGFYIDPYINDDNNIAIQISLLSCRQETREILKENALTWLSNHDIQIDDYQFEYINQCGN